MTKDEYSRKADELDRLLNDPNVPMEPLTIWRLADELSRADLPAPDPQTHSAGHQRRDM